MNLNIFNKNFSFKQLFTNEVPLEESTKEKTYSKRDMESAFDAGADAIEYDENHGFSSDTTFEEWFKKYNSY